MPAQSQADDLHEDPPRLPALVEAAADFRAGSFVLRDDLRRMEIVLRFDAPEATIFYATRVVEALTASVVRRLGLEPSFNLYDNLHPLESLSLMEGQTAHWAHALRRLGNDVRHVRRAITCDDAEFAVAALPGILEWFFASCAVGPRLPVVWQADTGPVGAEFPLTRQVVSSLARPDRSPASLVAPVEEYMRCQAGSSPSVPALLVDLLLSSGEHRSAAHVLTLALARFPRDLRLCQLRALELRRTGNFVEALTLLAGLKEDDETAGIAAAAHKAIWAQAGDPAQLQRAHSLYLRRWKASGKESAWLGINAATTALLLDRPAVAREIAAMVRGRLDRLLTLAARHSANACRLGFWDEVTLSEASLIEGDVPSAVQGYRKTFAGAGRRPGDIEVALGQARLIATRLGIDLPLADQGWPASDVPIASAEQP